MKIKKYFGLVLFCIAFNAQAFDLVKLDEAVLGFLNKWFAHDCADIGYSYHYALRVDEAYERGFYVEGWKPSDFNPPELPTDILVAFEANIKLCFSICGELPTDRLRCEDLGDSYKITLRKDSSGRYKTIGSHKYNPE